MITSQKVKLSQISLLLLLVIPGGKYLTLPGYLFNVAGRDSWMSFLFMFVLDFVCFLVLLWGLNLNRRGLSLNDVLCRTLSPVGAKIVEVVFVAFYLLRVCVLLLGCITLFSSTFAIKTNWFAFIVPVLMLVAVSLSQGIRNLARLTELLFVLVMLALLVVISLSFRSADFGNLRPFLVEGVAPVFKAGLNGSFWFADSVFILFFMDKIDLPKKKDNLALPSIMIVGIALTVLMDVVFIALFGNSSGLNDIAISKVSQFNIANSSYGRLDWLCISMWMCSIFIKIILYAFCTYRCVNWIVGYKKEKFNWWAYGFVAVVLTVLPLVVDIDDFIMVWVSQGFVKYIFLAVQYVLPLALPLLVKASDVPHRKKSPAALRKEGAV